MPISTAKIDSALIDDAAIGLLITTITENLAGTDSFYRNKSIFRTIIDYLGELDTKSRVSARYRSFIDYIGN